MIDVQDDEMWEITFQSSPPSRRGCNTDLVAATGRPDRVSILTPFSEGMQLGYSLVVVARS